jgi:hypothetical protein
VRASSLWFRAVVLVVAGITAPCHGDIIQDAANQSMYWPFGEVRGQTFTADETVTTLRSIGFYYSPGNPTFPDARPTMTLYQGHGYGGQVLGSVTLGPIPGSSPHHWVDADFSGVTLVVGEVYTFKLAQTPGASGGFMVWGHVTDDIYPHGVFLNSKGDAVPTHDLQFRVLAVPEPGSFGLLATAAGAIFFLRRWRR